MKFTLILTGCLFAMIFGTHPATGTENIPNESFPQKIHQLAEEMDVFPVDFIARSGPLSWYKAFAFNKNTIIYQE